MRADFLVIGLRVCAVLALAVLLMAWLESRARLLTRFRAEESTALNLAVARVVVMGAILASTRLDSLLAFAGLDRALIVPPTGWQPFVRYIPLATPVVIAAYGMLLVAATLALIGFGGRVMCALTAACALYLHTIPQLFGKVNHTVNHLVLFSALLAAAPSTDALSIDAVRAAVRDADRGMIRRIRAGRAYAFALQVMMVYIGLAYFFPGLWKVARVGARWFTSENLSRLILSKLQEMPMTGLQHWIIARPTLLWLMACATILFELGFVFAILWRPWRATAAVAGFGFHSLTALIMGIQFAALQVCYVVFIDWTRCLGWVARRRSLRPITLRYDAADGPCRRLVAILIAFDWLDLVRPMAMAPNGWPHPDGVRRRWTVVDEAGTESATPDAAARSIASRLPMLWPFRRLIGRRIGTLGARLAGRVAGAGLARRAPQPVPGAPSNPIVVTSATPVSPALRLAGAGLVGAFALAGIVHVGRGWPIACYPAFDVPEGASIEMLSVDAVDRDGTTHAWTLSFDPAMGRRFGTERWRGLVATVLSADRPFDPARARALLSLWGTEHRMPAVRSATLYGDRYLLTVDDPPPTPIERRLIGVVPPTVEN